MIRKEWLFSWLSLRRLIKSERAPYVSLFWYLGLMIKVTPRFFDEKEDIYLFNLNFENLSHFVEFILLYCRPLGLDFWAADSLC